MEIKGQGERWRGRHQGDKRVSKNTNAIKYGADDRNFMFPATMTGKRYRLGLFHSRFSNVILFLYAFR
jgi:hypothetical protein